MRWRTFLLIRSSAFRKGGGFWRVKDKGLKVKASPLPGRGTGTERKYY
jgi:hypothetical protein